MTKTFSAKPADVVHEWFVVDATDKVLGRVASEVALRLRGKHKAIYTPHVDTGDFIIVTNAAQLRVTGAKSLDKVYYSSRCTVVLSTRTLPSNPKCWFFKEL
jgi:large subunit ribosomal protein L13